MIRNSLLAAAVLVSCCAPLHAQSVLNGIAAEVSLAGQKEVVTFSEVRELVTNKERQAHETLTGDVLVAKIKEIRLAAINDLIDRALILQEFKSKGYVIPEYLIDERVKEVIRDSFGGDRAAFLRTLVAQGMTLEKFRDFQRDSIIVQEMRRMAAKGAGTVTDQKVSQYYRQNSDKYGTEEQARLRMIVIRNRADGESRRGELEEIRGKIAEGADFAEVARFYDESGNQESGGDVGWVNRKHFNESLTKTAFALKPGEMSEVIEMGGSYYLLQCEAKKAGGMRSLKEVRPEIEKALLQGERRKQEDDWLQKLRKKAYIKLY
jgi:peptidyl-prolyl cis-trans isomerase SurA